MGEKGMEGMESVKEEEKKKEKVHHRSKTLLLKS